MRSESLENTMKRGEEKMKENEIMELLSDDISEIELPPISEKVLQIVREKKEQSSHNAVKVNKKFPIKYIAAAMLSMLVVSVPIIIVLSNQNNTDLVSRPESEISKSESKMSKPESEMSESSEINNTLELIKKKMIFGEVALTKRSEEECEIYFANYQHGDPVYEDDDYLYHFDPDGNLIQLLNINTDEPDENSIADEKTIVSSAEMLFKYYYPMLNRKEYSLEIEKELDAMPAWIVKFRKLKDNIIESEIYAAFCKSGTLYMLMGTWCDETGNISIEQAVDIALNEIKNGKYDLPDFDRDDIEIHIEKRKDQPCYHLYISKIEKNIGFYASALVNIDAETGKITKIEIAY